VTNQYSDQINNWLKQLSDIRQENALIKFRLSELVDKSIMSEFLHKAEVLQSELLENDETIALLYDSAIHIESKLNNNNHRVYTHYLAKKKQLEEDLKIFAGRFLLLKKRFNDEMTEAGINTHQKSDY